MRVLLCGEGLTDYGHRDYQSGQWIEGPVQIFMQKIYQDEIEIESIEKQVLKKYRLGRKIQELGISGHGGKAIKLAILAREKGKTLQYVMWMRTKIPENVAQIQLNVAADLKKYIMKFKAVLKRWPIK